MVVAVAETVTEGLAFHWLCLTDFVVCPLTSLTAKESETSTPPEPASSGVTITTQGRHLCLLPGTDNRDSA